MALPFDRGGSMPSLDDCPQTTPPTPPRAAGLLRNRWLLCVGITGWLQPECPAALRRNAHAPAHTAIRYILQGLDTQAVERVFRRHAAGLRDTATDPARRSIALDGKTLRRSFDNFNDRKAAQLLHAFDVEAGLVLAHVDIEEKSNEIPAAQQLLGELQVAHCIVTLDAMHCQKKPSRLPQRHRLA